MPDQQQSIVVVEDDAGIRRVITHSEKAAAYMADGYARATGKPGICMAQVIGALNLAAGLRDALDCSSAHSLSHSLASKDVPRMPIVAFPLVISTALGSRLLRSPVIARKPPFSNRKAADSLAPPCW